jgi:hypothetical protein
MKTFVFIALLSLVNVFANADNYIAISTQEVKAITSMSGFNSKERLYGITIGGLFLGALGDRPAWEFSLDMSENAFNKLDNVRYSQIVLINVAVNLPVSPDYYLKIGVGSLKSNVVLSDGEKVEDQSVLNFRFGGGYVVTERFMVAAMFDTSTKAPSLQVGYVF